MNKEELLSLMKETSKRRKPITEEEEHLNEEIAKIILLGDDVNSLKETETETKVNKVISDLYWLIDCLRAYQEITQSGCCNDCGIAKTCQCKPKLGELVRYNCVFYMRKGKDV